MPLIVCYYHVVWATKHRAPLITKGIEPLIFQSIISKSTMLKSPIHGINGVADHIHVAVSLAPTLALSDWVKQTKGIATYEINQQFPELDVKFRWQNGYSAHTFGQNALPTVLRYIRNQKQHHSNGDVINYLETLDDDPRE
jgi:putative transposase